VGWGNWGCGPGEGAEGPPWSRCEFTGDGESDEPSPSPPSSVCYVLGVKRLRLVRAAWVASCGCLGRLRCTRLRLLRGRAVGLASSANFRLRFTVGRYLGRVLHTACVSSAVRRVRFHVWSSWSSESKSTVGVAFRFRP
jgi:hypothetical protein